MTQGSSLAVPYEILRGRTHGEVDPRDPYNRIIQDLDLAARNGRGKVEYVATFALARPIDPAKASGVLIYQVVNRGNGDVAPNAEGDIVLVSGWQGDVMPTAANQTITAPIARRADGSPVTGPVLARFVDVAAGTTTMSIRLSSMRSGPPVYPPAGLDQKTATLTMFATESPTAPRRRRRRRAGGLGLRRLPHDAVSRRARPDPHLREGRLRPGGTCSFTWSMSGIAGTPR